MKWKSHQAITAVAVMAVTENPILAVVAMQGAVLPDTAEFCLPRKLVPHRTWTHWWPVYMLPLFGAYYTLYQQGIPSMVSLEEIGVLWHVLGMTTLVPWGALAVFWLCIGALAHLIEDVVTGYIPVWTPYDRNRHKHRIWFYPGSPKEPICTCLICALICTLKGMFLWVSLV